MEDGKVIIKREANDRYDEVNNPGRTAEAMNILVSGILRKDGKTFVRVSFLRGRDWAEGIVPDGVIEKSEGFTSEEINKLEDYLLGEKDMIIRQARGINPIRNLFGI